MQNKKIVNGVIVAEETNKWIATKERLPTQDGYYLVTIEYTHKISVVKGKQKEKILKRTSVIKLEQGEKVLFKFDKNITKKDMEKCKKVLLSVFNGCDILAVSEGIEIQVTAEKGVEDEDTENTTSDTIHN